MRTWTILAIILMVMTETALADALLSAHCPDTVYNHEVFSCSVTIYNDSTTDSNLTYAASFNKGFARILGSPAGTISVPSFVEKEVEFNAWANETGTDVFTYEYGEGEPTALVGRRVVIVSSPLELDLERFQVKAGERTTVQARVSGNGEAVQVKIDLPAGVYGTKTVRVGDVSGSKDINFVITTDPYYIGSVRIPFYLEFYDKLGKHTEMYDVIMEVRPSLEVLAAGAAAIAVLLGAAYLAIRRWRSGGSTKSEED